VIEPHRDTETRELVAVVAQRLVEFVLARDDAGEIELAADIGCALEQRDAMAARCRIDRAGEPRRARSDHRDCLR
jgi:hypothetical protein